MVKTVKKKALKKRASTYNSKLAIAGTFEDVIAVSVSPKGTKKKPAYKKP
ncbi:MAG TPA: hypothetical protein VK498_08630 [Ferruginibacter sp.]|nr:hypothetical protein [Ferruginibacter sp.]